MGDTTTRASAPVNILIVDDDARNLDVLEAILDSPNYRLVRAQNADETLRALFKERFALLVLDVRMPDMNGLELAQLIKQRKKTEHLPIIFLTAYYQEDEHVLQGYGAGAVDYLNKPCNPSVLRSKVAAFVDLFLTNRALQDEIAERKLAEQRVAERTAEVNQLVSQLRALAAELTHAEQRERKRVAKTLHDGIQQLLVSAKMQLAAVRNDTISDRTRKIVQEVELALKEALEASRSLTIDLSPPILHEAGLAAGLQWLARWMADKNQFTVELQIDECAETSTEEERFLLFECARELIFNAVKHAGVSEVRLELRRTEDQRVQIVVEDKGKGFDLEQLRNRDGVQVTFGLFSIQQRLVHLGGLMEIETAPGQGARITLTSPVREAPGFIKPAELISTVSRIPSNPVRNRNNTAAITVLVVDDHKIMRQGLTELLRCESDIDVLGDAADGPTAMSLAEKLTPDVIIMDVNLGSMSGVQVTKAILAKNPKIRVIGLSMYAEEQVANAMLSAGAVAYLTKGDASQDLAAAIRSAMREPAKS